MPVAPTRTAYITLGEWPTDLGSQVSKLAWVEVGVFFGQGQIRAPKEVLNSRDGGQSI